MPRTNNISANVAESAKYIEKTVGAAGVDSINISATTNGKHAPNSNYYNGQLSISTKSMENGSSPPELTHR